MVVRRRYRPIQIQLIIIIIIIIQALLDLILNMEDMDRLRSLVVVLTLEVTDSPSLEVVHHPFPVEMEYCSLTVMHLLSLALLLSLMADTLDLLHTLVDIILLLDHLHTVTVAVDTIHHLDLLHTVVVDIMHLLDLLLGSLTRAATEKVPVILNSLELIRHGETVITLPIQVDGEANKNMA